ncbi:YhgE/Pip domain-containing protein [Brachybacterium sp. FME24]|uniref:YhgE/Pip domain-containing protein n=1 Tax=Brachybacterium sp. FME24 TaxID=2742605 RepID=UPI0018691057|nr:YhgE/Pip domain-containing protein [Brachybacterium sp. FME24]
MRILRALQAALTAVAHALLSALRGAGRGIAAAGRGAVALLPGEWKKPIAALFVVGLALVPVIYSGNMTWSFHDPSNNLDQITAAVVDEDEGATMTSPAGGDSGEETSIDVGREFTDTLIDMDKENVYRFVEVSAAEAHRGLEDGTYGATVEIPSSFSANVASLGGEAEQAAPALLTVTTNDSINYVGGNFSKSVGTALTDSLRASVLEEYLSNVYVGFTTIHDGIAGAADGSSELADGTTELADGTGDLVSGSSELTEGTGELASGADELATGASTVHDGSLDLVVGLDQLTAGAVELRSGTATLREGADQLSTGLVTLDEKGRPLRTGADDLAAGTDQLATGATDLSDGAEQVAGGTQQLDETISAAQQRAEEIGVTPEGVQTTSDDLVAAIDTLEGAATGLSDRLQQPAADAGTLSDAATALDQTATSADDAAQALDSDTTDRAADARTLQDGAASIAEDAATLDTAAQDTANATDTATDSATTAQDGVQAYTDSVDDLAARCEDSGADAAFCEELAGVSETSQQTRDDAAQASTDATTAHDAAGTAAEQSTSLEDTATGMTDSADAMVTYLEDLSTTTTSLAEGTSSVAGTTGALAEDSSSLDSDLATLREDTAAAAPTPERGSTASDLAADLTEQARTAALALPDAYATLQQGADDVRRLNSGAQDVSSGAEKLAAASGTAKNGAQDLASGVGQYTDGVGTARTGAEQLADGSADLATGADQLADGTREARAGSGRLADGAGELDAGATELADGAGQVDDGAGELADGAVQLDEGADEVRDGSAELRDGLRDAEGDVPSYTDTEGEELAQTASDPVQMSFERDHELSRFGEGLAPLFLAISLWVGGMAIFLMMPPFSTQAASRGVGPARLLAGGLVPAFLLGLVQSAIAVGALHWAVGITMDDLPLLFGLSAITSLVFVALNHGFGALFGPVGKFVALVLVALQISGAGGTYPTATLPQFFQVIHPFLPMTHAVDAFRGAIGGGWVDPTGDLLWLAGWLAVGVALGLVGAVVQRRRALQEADGHTFEEDPAPAGDLSTPDAART